MSPESPNSRLTQRYTAIGGVRAGGDGRLQGHGLDTPFGTITNTLSKACEVTGTIRAVPKGPVRSMTTLPLAPTTAREPALPRS
jgi:hypothetical protein